MIKIFVDTNILLDLVARRAPFYEESALLFSLADNKKVEIAVSALSIANLHYVLSRELNNKQAKTIIRKLKILIQVLPINDKIIGLALNDDSFTDFEDALQYFSAIEGYQSFIITRNLKDFKKAKLPVLTAKQFIETIS
jgi:predicted nucleic acid-binding protein